MVYLTLAVVILIVVLWKVSSRSDPNHLFIFSLLPLLDLEHTAGTQSDINQNGKDSAMAGLVAHPFGT